MSNAVKDSTDLLLDEGLHLKVRDQVKEVIVRNKFRVGQSLPTYQEFSKRLGVSLATIQKAMHLLKNEGIIDSKPRRGTILAAKLTTKKRRVSRVALIFGPTKRTIFREMYLHELLKGLLIGSDDQEVDIHILSIKTDGMAVPNELSMRGIDGAILCSITNEDYLRRFSEAGMPVVVVDGYHEDIPLTFMAVDNRWPSVRAVEHLYQLGHRRIAYVDGFSLDAAAGSGREFNDPVIETTDVRERRDTYVDTMARFGLKNQSRIIPHPATQDADKNSELLGKEIEKALSAEDPPTGLVAYDTAVAMKLIEELRARGLKCPQDISITAILGTGQDGAREMGLTHSMVSFESMGMEAVGRLVNLQDVNIAEQNSVTRFPSDFFHGTSTRSVTPVQK